VEEIHALSKGDEEKLTVELLTQKGRNNLTFKTDDEIVFFIKANRNVFAKIYSKDSEGNILRIYPNDFVDARKIFKAGEVTSIPDNKYDSRFKFTVAGTTGDEIVFAFTSDKVLPDLPSKDAGTFGMRVMQLDVNGMKKAFTEYALGRGNFLSWDSIPVRTLAK